MDFVFDAPINAQAFSSVHFDFTGSEILNFDYVQYDTADVPEPATLSLLAIAGAGLGASRLRRARSR